ncbi:MAG: Ig-like domain-containing protein [Clostridia bacterium]|nr:Ig-like domain-containing protein [Clostridia bacterium]MDY2930118.1 Ig-like domain-containing protein [Clostridiaceae bacterium]
MKLFGKKTLALALALTMVLSLCSFTAFGADFAISGTTHELTGVGSTTQLQAIGQPEDATVTWSSSPTGVVTVDNGLVTAVASGTTTITASYTPVTEGEQSTATWDIKVVVLAETVTITDKTQSTMYLGQSSTLSATVLPEGATDRDVTWSSSNPSVVEINSTTGAIKAKSAGTSTITATAKDASKKSDSFEITVQNDTVKTATITEGTMQVPYGTTQTSVINTLKDKTINVTYQNGGTAEVKVNDWSCSNYSATGIGETYIFTAAAPYNTVTVSVQVVKAKVTENVVLDAGTVSLGTAQNALDLPVTATVKLNSGTTATINIGSGADYSWVCDSLYKPMEKGTYNFTAKLADGKSESRFDMDGHSVKVRVVVADYIPVNKATTSMAYTRTNVSVDLTSTIETAVNAKIRERMGSSYNARTTIESVVLSGSNSYGVMGTGSNKAVFTVTKTLPSSGTATQDFTYIALGNDGQKYSGTVTLTIYSGTFDVSDATSTSDPIVYFSGSNGIANKIADAFKARYGSTPTYIEFGSIGRNDDELGELRDGNGDSVEDGTYTFASKDEDYDSVANIYFVPTGVGGTFEIEYTAYAKNSTRTKMEGTITIDCKKMLVVWLNDMGLGETQNLSASAIQEQVDEILNTKKISYTLDTVTIKTSSVSGGKVVDANNKVVSTSKKIDAADLDDYAYQAPSKMPSSGDPLVVIRFNATETADTGRKSDNEDLGGVMLFNLTKKADITITAPANDAAVLGTDVFQTYFEKNASSTYRKNYDACYVVFSGAPNSNTSGYLYDGYKSGIINGSKIKSPNGKKFALTDISAYDKNAYDLSNTYYVPGSRNCTGGTFEIYGVKSGTTIKSSTRFTKLCEGSIDYVVGSAAAAITGTINASNYMQMTPSAFTKSNKNASYVVFTAQPAGGKLVYNYNRTTPGVVKEISLNTPYYITYSAANANYYLGYVSFVPAYTAVKGVTSVVDIPCTIYSSSKTGTAASVKISVVSATKSAKFTDVGVAYMPYADSIDFLYNCGITTGTSTTGSLYNPSGSVTRGEWITMLYRAAGSPKMSNKIPFTDVTAKNSYSWCYDAVRWAYQNNICQGTGATTFSPAMKLDRQQIVTFMYNYAVKYNGGNGAGSSINGYTDSASVASWAKAPMEWAVKNQYYTVIGTRLQPTDSANRAEVALYMHRLLTY